MGDLSLDHTNCDLGFGHTMLPVALGLSLTMCLCFGATVAMRLNLSLAEVLNLILVTAMAGMVSFESLASYL